MPLFPVSGSVTLRSDFSVASVGMGQMVTRGRPKRFNSGERLWAVRKKRVLSIKSGVMRVFSAGLVTESTWFAVTRVPSELAWVLFLRISA